MIEAGLALSRWLQFAAAAALFGMPVFALYGLAAARASQRAWLKRSLVAAAALGLAAALLMLSAEAAEMSGDAALAIDPQTIWDVISGTYFGAVWSLRFLILLAALALSIAYPRPPIGDAALAIAGAFVAGSLAWLGHGGEGGPALGVLHRLADVAHVLAASVWIGALIVLARLLRGEDASAAQYGLSRFSGIGSLVVATLLLTGVVNAWAVTAPRPLPEAAATPYAAVLFLKLGLFAAMLALAALNRFVLTPRLRLRSMHPGQTNATLRRLRWSVGLETALAALVIAAVAVLGVLEPPNAAP